MLLLQRKTHKTPVKIYSKKPESNGQLNVEK